MIGILYYFYFLILGFVYSKYIFKKNIYFHIWFGGIIGNLICMIGIIIPSLIFKFTIISHIILIILSIIPLLIIIKKNGINSFKNKLKEFGKEEEMNNKIFFFVIIPIFILIAILLTNHILVPTKDGGVAVGQSTYGDLNMHLGFITSIAEQKQFPPNYVFLSGVKLNYPFYINMLSSSLYLMGTTLRLSILVPSYIVCLLLVMGFYYLSYKITNNKKASVLSTIFFFLCGGFGFAYFFNGAKEDINNFTKIFTEYYQTPTNFNGKNIRWANSICDMIIPQRTTMAGWFMIMPCLYLLIEACRTNKRKLYVFLGILAGCMPMIHTHSFLALGIICVGMFITNIVSRKDKKEYFINWIIFGIITLSIAMPQLMFWTFKQTTGNNNFLKIHFNWVNKQDPYIWFYIKNFGMTALCIIPAFFNTKKENKRIIISSLLLMIVAEIILFQPNEYDNNKLIFITYMIFLIISCEWLVYIFQKLKNVNGRLYISIIVITLFTLSGVLTIGREIYSGGKYQTFSSDMIKMSEYIKKKTEPDAIFLTSTTHINPVATLAGRNVYVGSSLYVYFHGLGEIYAKREAEIKKAYSLNYEELRDFCKKNNIKYIYLGTYELGSFNPNLDTFKKLKKIATYGTETLYEVNFEK